MQQPHPSRQPIQIGSRREGHGDREALGRSHLRRRSNLGPDSCGNAGRFVSVSHKFGPVSQPMFPNFAHSHILAVTAEAEQNANCIQRLQNLPLLVPASSQRFQMAEYLGESDHGQPTSMQSRKRLHLPKHPFRTRRVTLVLRNRRATALQPSFNRFRL